MRIIKTGQGARDALIAGINLVADRVKSTLGPGGRNAVIGRMDITPIVTNDGVTLALNIEAEDEFENLGVKIVQEAASLTDNSVGDGTTTTTVLLQAIVTDLSKKLEKVDTGSMLDKHEVMDALQLKRDIDVSCESIVSQLRVKTRPMTKEDIYNIALVSSEYDWMAKVITDVYTEVGAGGYVSVKEGVKTRAEIFKGVELNVGYQSDYFANNDKRECVIENPRIIVTNNRVDTTSIAPIVNLVQKLAEKDIKELIVIAPEFSRDVLSRFVTTKLKAGFTIIALPLPTFDKDDVLMDICALTGAKLLDKNAFSRFELFLEEFKLENVGEGEEAIVGDSKTFISGKGDTTDRVKHLQEKREKSESIFDRDVLEKRIAHLAGGVATIYIGGESEFEKGYMKLKAEDAVNAVKVAFEEGVIPGGGIALMQIADGQPNDLLSRAIRVPYQEIQKNAGGILIITDAIIDPVKVTISALKTACSLAGMVLTTETLVAFKNEDKKPTYGP